MLYYFIAMMFPLICWGAYTLSLNEQTIQLNIKNNQKKLYTIVSILPMFLLFVLRNKYIGSDTIGYVNFFEKIIPNYSIKAVLQGESTDNETGFALYVKIISIFTNNYTIFFLVNGIVIFYSLWFFAHKYTSNPFLFFFLFLSLGTYDFIMTGLRQALAISICLWAVNLVVKKKFIPFLLCVFFATLFHKSAWIFLIVYPLSFVKKKNALCCLYLTIIVIFVLAFSRLQDVFNKLIGYDYDVEETGNGFIFFIFLSIIFVFSIYLQFGEHLKNEKNNAIMHLSILAVIFWILRLISRSAERISFYFICGIYAYFAQTQSKLIDKFYLLIKFLLVACCFLLNIYRNWGISYQFFWNN